MKFFILGDSWGLGEYKIDNPIGSMVSLIPDTGLDYYLRKQGHIVKNVSSAGAGNFGQLRHSYQQLQKDSDYDYMIWFHTEPVRDMYETIIDDPIDGPKQYPDFRNIKNFHKATDYVNYRNYKFAEEVIFNEFKIPFIPIGGLGRLDTFIDEFQFAKYKIYSWPKELLNLDYDLPRNCLKVPRSPEVFSTFKFDKFELTAEIDAALNYQELCKQSPLFPDHMHVTRTEYEKLAFRIIKMLT